MRQKLDRKTFNRIATLYQQNEWLTQNDQALMDLIDLCQNHGQQQLILDLLGEFKYLNNFDKQSCINEIVTQIVDIWKLPADHTQLVALTPNDEPDSSEAVMLSLRTELARRNIRDYVLKNRFQSAIARVKSKHIIVFIDEFVGTGKTAAKRVRDFLGNVKGLDASKQPSQKPLFYICTYALMKFAYTDLSNYYHGIFTCNMLQKGITQHYLGKNKRRAVKHMLALESYLEDNILKKYPLPSFGYERSEALFCAEDSSVPNNVFPIFWWPKLADNEERETILHRYSLGRTG